MPDPALCTEADIRKLVHQFYARVRADARLGPIFDAHIDDWPAHLQRLCDFWSSILRGSGRFTGAPMPKHIALPDLDAALFEHWLQLFHATTAEQANQAMARQADAAAQRIAQSLWLGYQSSRRGGKPDGAQRQAMLAPLQLPATMKAAP
ncbi:group III truncated hemoglobin [Corticibacter populi]|uniref:Group III truncated hemoglobin n=1 Tax=Corticibacter populi TaxID=1550736 RepID=A0A3M6QM92_9BURK|nr:group III truncated hemoglobin [Corticibacter populi]RMX04203.1 group III truncated hemoglobin [Corticibacter populi]RZS33230.1 hemoglobin [Corticibacter populi]